MIKTTLKHWIYEMCIKVFFERLFTNFRTGPISLKVGEYYTLIVAKFEDCYIEMHRCRIKDTRGNEIGLTTEHYIDLDYDNKMNSEVINSAMVWSIEFEDISEIIK